MNSFITGYTEGADITIMNTIAHKGYFTQDKKYVGPALDIIYKDNVTGKKQVEQIDTPMYEYYLLNDGEYETDYPREFAKKEEVHPVLCEFSKLTYDIAEKTGNLDWYNNNKKTGNGSLNKKIHYHPNVFRSDMNMSDFYRFQFGKNYKNDVIPVSKLFFDIECDIIDIAGDFQETGEAPVNALTAVMNHTAYVFLLRDPENPQCVQFEQDVKDGIIEPEFCEFIRNYIGGDRPEVFDARLKALDMESFHIKFFFFDSEIQLIAAFFGLVNKFQPDFCLAWNMNFDMPNILERIKANGYDPCDIACHPDFKKNRVAEYVAMFSQKNPDDYAERGDYCNISGYSNWHCQLINFASKRKGQHALERFSLDYIGGLVCGVKKLDYSHICSHIKDLPRKDYKTFVLYNIVDVVVQKCIEARGQDVEFLFTNAIKFNTRYSKVYRQTVFLANHRANEFDKMGFIVGNNTNKENEKIHYPGGFVADLTLISSYPMDKLNGVPIRLFRNLVDFDYTSLYPSIWRQWNMCRNGMIGQMQILEPSKYGNKYGVEDYDINIAFAQDIHSNNWIEFSERWLNLADFETMVGDVNTYFEDRIPHGFMDVIDDETGMIKPFEPMRRKIQMKRQGKLIRPFVHRECKDYANFKYDVVRSVAPYSLDTPMENLYEVYSEKYFNERPDVLAIAAETGEAV